MNSTPVPAQTPFDPSSSQIHELHLSKDAEDWLKTLSPGLFNNYKEIESTWNHPLAQFSMTLVKDPEFRGALTEIYTQHPLSTCVGYEMIWVLLIWILRAYRLGKVNTWLLRIWTQAWVGVFYFLGAWFVVPYLLWGKSYLVVIGQLTKAIIRHFFA